MVLIVCEWKTKKKQKIHHMMEDRMKYIQNTFKNKYLLGVHGGFPFVKPLFPSSILVCVSGAYVTFISTSNFAGLIIVHLCYSGRCKYENKPAGLYTKAV